MTVFSARDRKTPLLLSFLHKPLRATNELEKATTRHNSLINRFVQEVAPTPTPPVLPSLSCPLHSPPYSPQLEPLSPVPLAPLPPKLVRKKLGEVVKPVIRELLLHRRARSLPLTPTLKVHFGVDTDVKYFHECDRPLAISNPNSPDAPHLDSEWLESDAELNNWSLDHHTADTAYPRPLQWLILLLNFPHLSYTKCIAHKQPVFLERVFLLHETMLLVGHVAVRNLAFEKFVTVRYSLDNWLTIIELPASYLEDRPDILKRNNYDRFVFDIPLEKLFSSFYINRSALVGANERTYEFCVKYIAEGIEYWDNNGHANYKITLHRKVTAPPRPQTLSAAQQVLNGHNATPKPRYSKSFLKRRTPDSNTPQPSKQLDCDTKLLDFESNQYFLSLPMLSLYKHDAPARSDTALPMPDIELSKQLAVNQSLELGESQPNPLPEPDRMAPSQLDSQLYKELLENYCFFRGNEEQDDETKPEGHKPFTVHAFLHS